MSAPTRTESTETLPWRDRLALRVMRGTLEMMENQVRAMPVGLTSRVGLWLPDEIAARREAIERTLAQTQDAPGGEPVRVTAMGEA